MADHSPLDYEMEESLRLETSEQYKALFDDTRSLIIDLLGQRAATIKELSDALGKPKGTVGHHVAALADAGLIRVVRTEKVRAIEAKYYGRTARTFIIAPPGNVDTDLTPDHFLTTASREFVEAEASREDKTRFLSTLRHVRVPDDRADEYVARLLEISEEFIEEPRGGDTTFGMMLAFYPTDFPNLPDRS